MSCSAYNAIQASSVYVYRVLPIPLSTTDSVKARHGRVFVHCYAGVSRSATVCIAYIMKLYRQGLTSAYDYVKCRRPCISPNLHFMGQLLKFDQQLQATAAAEASPDDRAAHLSSRLSSGDSMDRNLQSLALSGLRAAAKHHQKSAVGIVVENKRQSSSAPSCLNLNLPSRPASLSLSSGATVPLSSARLSWHWSHEEAMEWHSGLSPHSVSLPCTPSSRLTPQFPPRRWAGLPSNSGSSSSTEGSDAQRGGLSQSLRLASPCRVAALCTDPSITLLDLNAH